MTAFKHPCRRRDSGFSLIEVLIALVILSVGLLGIAAMVSISMKSKTGSYYRTQALALSGTILDRMRANRAAALTGAYDIAVAQGTVTTGSLSSQDCTNSSCTSAQIATMDLAQWNNDLVQLLGNNSATNVSYSITTTAVAQFTQVQVVISWNDTPANQALGASTNSGANTANSACSGASTNPGAIAALTGGSPCYNAIVITSGL